MSSGFLIGAIEKQTQKEPEPKVRFRFFLVECIYTKSKKTKNLKRFIRFRFFLVELRGFEPLTP